jgi:predicted methyltransferase MtxX (methanogen marker protein 4)
MEFKKIDKSLAYVTYASECARNIAKIVKIIEILIADALPGVVVVIFGAAVVVDGVTGKLLFSQL